MKERIGRTSYPLDWPMGWARKQRRNRAGFGDTNVYRETQKLRREMELLPAREVVVSSNLMLRQDGIPYANQRKPEDPGVAVWFWLPKKGVGIYTQVTPDRWTEHVLACDCWDRTEHNLRAVVKHVEAIRGQKRWGVGSIEQALHGYQHLALPETAGSAAAWQVLGIERQGATAASVHSAYKRAARTAHPDVVGGSREAWDALQAALEAALAELGAA